MTDTKHELSDYSVYECVLEAADERIEALVGVELPFLSAWPLDVSGGVDEDYDDRMIRISFEHDYLDQSVEGEFQVSENILKGIAKGRDEDFKAFVDAFLPTFRPGYMQAVLRNELHILEGDCEHQRHIDTSDAYDVFHSFGTEPWVICDVKVRGHAPDLFRVEVVFENEEFDQLARQQSKTGNGIDWDKLLLPISLTWSEFNSATATHDDLMRMLARIHREFLVRKDSLHGSYSKAAHRLIDYLDALDEGDDERLAEDPFTTGELALDEDGRVHFASDLEK
jgi:hypothetical protein